MAMRERFSVGAVLSRSFASWIGNFIPFTVLGALVYLPIELYTWVTFRDPEATSFKDVLSWGQATDLGGQLLMVVLMGPLAYGVFRQLRGKRATMAGCIRVGVLRLFPVLLVAFLMWVVVAVSAIPLGIAVVVFGTSPLFGVLIAIPAVILLAAVVCQLWVSIPVAVVEKPGTLASLKRSGELTKGHRGSIFGILLLLGAFNVLVQKIVTNVFEITKTSTMTDVRDLAWAMVVVIVEMAILQAITATVIYHDLRLSKEGVGVEELAAVFE